MPRNLRTEICVSRLALLPGRTKAGAPASVTMVLGCAIESYGEGRGEVKKTEASTDLKRIGDDKSRKRCLALGEGFCTRKRNSKLVSKTPGTQGGASVYIPAEIRQLIATWKAVANPPSEDELLFSSRAGTPMSARNFFRGASSPCQESEHQPTSGELSGLAPLLCHSKSKARQHGRRSAAPTPRANRNHGKRLQCSRSRRACTTWWRLT
jgi:hypothetical protein